METFSERLKIALKSAGYTQKKITEELNLSKNAMTNYVGGRIPDATILYKISKVLGVSMEWLISGEESTVIHQNSESFNDEELRIIKLFRKLDQKEKNKIEGMLEMKAYESESLQVEELSSSLIGSENRNVG